MLALKLKAHNASHLADRLPQEHPRSVVGFPAETLAEPTLNCLTPLIVCASAFVTIPAASRLAAATPVPPLEVLSVPERVEVVPDVLIVEGLKLRPVVPPLRPKDERPVPPVAEIVIEPLPLVIEIPDGKPNH